MSDKQLERKVRETEIFKKLSQSEHYKITDTDFDDGECRIVFENENEPGCSVTVMYQEN